MPLVAPLLVAGALLAAETPVTTLKIEPSARRTREATVQALLPRPLPTPLDDRDLEELDRRLRNLEIYDDVAVVRRGEAVEVRLREKFTLRPEVALATGRTLRDSYLMLGLTEYNLAGTAAALSGWASWEQRGANGGVSFRQHPYAPRRLAKSAEAAFYSSDVTFSEGVPGDVGWEHRFAEVSLGFGPPVAYGSAWRLAGGPLFDYDETRAVSGVAPPPSGVWGGAWTELTFDRYTWDDLAPSGIVATAGIVGASLLGRRTALLLAQLTLVAARPLADWLLLAARLRGDALAGGTVGWAPVLGTQEGVRGLPEAVYRNRAHAFANVELRATRRLGARLAAQAVGFADGALFRRLGPRGESAGGGRALAVGAGVRLVPTALAGLLLRVDGARLVAPEELWFWQIGLDQYF